MIDREHSNKIYHIHHYGFTSIGSTQIDYWIRNKIFHTQLIANLICRGMNSTEYLLYVLFIK
jgi:hypothetical protein